MITQHKERLLLLFQSIVFPKVFLFCSFCHTAQWYNLSFNSVKYWCCHRSLKKTEQFGNLSFIVWLRKFYGWFKNNNNNVIIFIYIAPHNYSLKRTWKCSSFHCSAFQVLSNRGHKIKGPTSSPLFPLICSS